MLISDVHQLEDWVSLPLLKQASVYWPGAVSVVLPLGAELAYAHKLLNGLPFRIPNNTTLQNLAKEAGPIATTSANLPGKPPVATIEEAIELFGDNVDFYVDGGEVKNQQASKIIKIHDNGEVEVIREG